MIEKLFQFCGRLVQIALRNPRDLAHVLGVANSVAGDIGIRRRIPVRSLPLMF